MAARLHPYVRKPDAETIVMMSEAEAMRLFLVQEKGPTCFVLEDENGGNHRVSIGSLQECSTCSSQSRPTLCPHILFVMLRVFRLPKENPMVYQVSLVDDEIEKLLSGRTKDMQARRGAKPRSAPSSAKPADSGKKPSSAGGGSQAKVPQKVPEPGETCPICQDEMVQGEELTYCSLGCGNSIHVSCMRHYARHQQSQELAVKCPLCRQLWDDIPPPERKKPSAPTRRPDAHYGVTCHLCHEPNISGVRYRCVYCTDYDLCQGCYNMNAHSHPFQQRATPTSAWETTPERKPPAPSEKAELKNGALPDREITQEDYDLILKMEEQRPDFEARHPLLATRLGSEVASLQPSLMSSPRGPESLEGSLAWSSDPTSEKSHSPSSSDRVQHAPAAPPPPPAPPLPQNPVSGQAKHISAPLLLRGNGSLKRGHWRRMQDAPVGGHGQQEMAAVVIAGNAAISPLSSSGGSLGVPQTERRAEHHAEHEAAGGPQTERRAEKRGEMFPPIHPVATAGPRNPRLKQHTTNPQNCRTLPRNHPAGLSQLIPRGHRIGQLPDT
eukprot:m51a1_g3022 hypothetical protein (553) ;mRNA; f:872780-874780